MSHNQSAPYAETVYGFEWGAVKVERFLAGRCRCNSLQCVTLALTTPRQSWQVHVSPTGVLRFFRSGKSRRKRRWAKHDHRVPEKTAPVKARPADGKKAAAGERE